MMHFMDMSQGNVRNITDTDHLSVRDILLSPQEVLPVRNRALCPDRPAVELGAATANHVCSLFGPEPMGAKGYAGFHHYQLPLAALTAQWWLS